MRKKPLFSILFHENGDNRLTTVGKSAKFSKFEQKKIEKRAIGVYNIRITS